jgi:hypothetical protein
VATWVILEASDVRRQFKEIRVRPFCQELIGYNRRNI